MHRFAAVIGGISPDIDIFLGFIPMVAPGYYLLSHRGIFHSFALVWIMVLTGFFIFTRKPIKKLIRRVMKYDIELEISPRVIIFGYTGAVIHLLLDALTMDGPTLFYPLTEKRVSVNLFPYGSEILLIPLGAVIIIFSTRRPWQKMKPVFAGFLILVLVLACTRVTFRMRAPDCGEVYPASNMNEWVVVERGDGFIKATIYDSISGTSVITKTFADARSNTSLSSLLAKSDAIPEIRWWLWGNSVVSVTAERDEPNRTWKVYYTSVIDEMNYIRSGGIYFWYGSNFTTTVEIKD